MLASSLPASHEIGANLHGRKKIAEEIGIGFHKIDLGARGHGVGNLNVQRLFQFPAARGVNRRGGATGVDNREVGGGKAKLRREGGKVGGGRRVVISIDNGNGAASAAGVRGGAVRIAAGHSGDKPIDAGE